jgi:deoxyribodipyrimidine photo-lyase
MTADPHQIELGSMKSISADASEQLNSLRSTKHRQWIRHSGDMQAGGPNQAQQVLNSFLNDRGWGYQKFISKPEQSRTHCSRLSPYLAWGNLSMRQAYQALLQQEKKAGLGTCDECF